jgi:hypothetical protein
LKKRKPGNTRDDIKSISSRESVTDEKERRPKGLVGPKWEQGKVSRQKHTLPVRVPFTFRNRVD